MSKIDASRLREPAAWIMLVAGATSTLADLVRLLAGFPTGSSSSFAARSFSALYGLTSPVTIALLIGSFVLVAKLGDRTPRAKLITYGAAGTLALAAAFGVLAFVVSLFTDGFGGAVYVLFTGLPLLALTVIALVYLLPEVLPARSAAPPFAAPGYASQHGQATYGQATYGQQSQYGQQPQYGEQQPHYGEQQPQYGQQQPVAEPQYGQQAQQYGQPQYGQQQPSGQQPPMQQPPMQAPRQELPALSAPVPVQPQVQPHVQPLMQPQAEQQYGYAPQPDPAPSAYAPAETPPSTYAPQAEGPQTVAFPPSAPPSAPEYQPAPYTPADSLPNAYTPAESQPNVYQQPESQASHYQPVESQANAYQPVDNQPGYGQPGAYGQPSGYQQAESQPNVYAPAENRQSAYDQPYGSPTPAETAPSVPYPPVEQQPYYEGAPPVFEQFDQRGGQPFTGYSGQEFAQAQRQQPVYQEPDPPVDPRSQQIMNAYQQAENYQQSSAGTHPQLSYEQQPDLRVPDYTGQQQPRSYDDPFGHPQNQQQNQQQGQPPNQQPSAYQPGNWDEPVESTLRFDPSAYQGGDALDGPSPQGHGQPGDEPIDPTAIYTPNDPRR